MKPIRVIRLIVVLLWGVALSCPPSFGQITADTLTNNDLVLNARYVGDIDSLRKCTEDVPYGEIYNFAIPTPGYADCGTCTVGAIPLQTYACTGGSLTYAGGSVCFSTGDVSWDRSMIRLYEGFNACGRELDPNDSETYVDLIPLSSFPYPVFSIKVLSTRGLGELELELSYEGSVDFNVEDCVPWLGCHSPCTGQGMNDFHVEGSKTIKVQPTAGSGCGLGGLSEAFHLATPLLAVEVGAAGLEVIAGETADMIGMSFYHRGEQTTEPLYDVRLPGWAETLFIPNQSQFSPILGTPWCGLMIGYRVSSQNVEGPAGTTYVFDVEQNTGLLEHIRPPSIDNNTHPAVQSYQYTGAGEEKRVWLITDHAGFPNWIRLWRYPVSPDDPDPPSPAAPPDKGGVVYRITTSDERRWDLETNYCVEVEDEKYWYVTAVIPLDRKGARYYGRNSAGRITTVADAWNRTMYAFDYAPDASARPVILTNEYHYINEPQPSTAGALQRVAAHTYEEHRITKNLYVEPGKFRRVVYEFNTNGLDHELEAIKTYTDVFNGPQDNGGTEIAVRFEHDVENVAGNMQVTQITLPDPETGSATGMKIKHTYNDEGFRTRTVHEAPNGEQLVVYDVEYEMYYGGSEPVEPEDFCDLTDDFGEWTLRLADVNTSQVGWLDSWSILIEGEGDAFQIQSQLLTSEPQGRLYIPDLDPLGVIDVIYAPPLLENIRRVTVGLCVDHPRPRDLHITLTHRGITEDLSDVLEPTEKRSPTVEQQNDAGGAVATASEPPPAAPRRQCVEYVICSTIGRRETDRVATFYHLPRIIKSSDARGNVTRFDYENGGEDENGDGVKGEVSNNLLSITGPTVYQGPSAPRYAEMLFEYDGTLGVMTRAKTRFADGPDDFLETAYEYDSLRRLTKETDDPQGLAIATAYRYDQANRLVTVTDPAGYKTRYTYDNDGRVLAEYTYLTEDVEGEFYGSTNVYNSNGRLSESYYENEDQTGQPVPGQQATIDAYFYYDRIGRMTKAALLPAGVAQTMDYHLNWQGEVLQAFDTSGRGYRLTYDGRGLVSSEVPLAQGVSPVADLITQYAYDFRGALTSALSPTQVELSQEYDDFGRTTKAIQKPRSQEPQQAEIVSNLLYDPDGNVTRQTTKQGEQVFDDAGVFYDEEGRPFEMRQHIEPDSGGLYDEIARISYDYAGRVVESRRLGDQTPVEIGGGRDAVQLTQGGDAFQQLHYDKAGRLTKRTDSENGQVIFGRDPRGQITTATIRTSERHDITLRVQYDALGRATKTVDGEGYEKRMDYDSRGYMRRMSLQSSRGECLESYANVFDEAGRLVRTAKMAECEQTTPDETRDWVVDYAYDADARLLARGSYNNFSTEPIVTYYTYDPLGRTSRVNTPCGGSSEHQYAPNGLVQRYGVADGLGTRIFNLGYDGHNRVTTLTADGNPQLVTQVQYDGLGRRVASVDPAGKVVQVQYDLGGRVTQLLEDPGGIARRTDFSYDSKGLLTSQTAYTSFLGTPYGTQTTNYVYDSVGRLRYLAYPDSTGTTGPSGQLDMVELKYDDVGRLTQHVDQRGWETSYAYDDRGLLTARQTDTARERFNVMDNFDYDGAGRLTLATRGPPGNPGGIARTERHYNNRGDLLEESQWVGAGQAYTTSYAYDQGGNVIGVLYPDGRQLVQSYNSADQLIDIRDVNEAGLAYEYDGCVLTKRRVSTCDEFGNKYYDRYIQYNDHRWVSRLITNFVSGRGTTTIADFTYTRDNAGNPLAVLAHGTGGFADLDRTFSYDSLHRLTSIQYAGGDTEATILDELGNRIGHADRDGQYTAYALGSAANEYASVGLHPVTYDAAGNLTVDEDGHRFEYDELDRLVEVRAEDGTALAEYTYDALGRRVAFDRPDADSTIRYYYDRISAVEERAEDGELLRSHVLGGQYIDERAYSYDAATGECPQYILGDLYSVAGVGNADGTEVEAWDMSPYGTFTAGTAECQPMDINCDTVVDAADIQLVNMSLDTTPADPDWLERADLDGDNLVELEDDLRPVRNALGYSYGGGTADIQDNIFTLHGRELDVLSDGLVLQYHRARHYIPQQGRWLQRDPKNYVDGMNLYEAFGANPVSLVDPRGTVIEEFFNWRYNDKWASTEELRTALDLGMDFSEVTGEEVRMIRDAGEALFALTNPGLAASMGITVDPLDVVSETGKTTARMYNNAVESSTERMIAVAEAQMEAGVSLEEATSGVFLSAVVIGDKVGVTPALEARYDVDLATNEQLSTIEVDFGLFVASERFRRTLQGGGQLGIIIGTAGMRSNSALARRGSFTRKLRAWELRKVRAFRRGRGNVGSTAARGGVSGVAPNNAVSSQFSRMRTAARYLKDGRYFDGSKWRVLTRANRRTILSGIDFTKGVRVVNLPRGTNLIQYVRRGGRLGPWFTVPGTPASRVGLFGGGRNLVPFRTSLPTQVLETTAKPIMDTWSVPGFAVPTEGGGVQYYIFQSYKVFPK